MRRLALIAALVFASFGCDDDDRPGDDPNDPDDPDDPDDPMPDATFTAFVIDLVETKTADDTDPVPFADFESLPDPDADNNNEDAFTSLFD